MGIFSHLFDAKKCTVCSKKGQNKQKRDRGLPNFDKKRLAQTMNRFETKRPLKLSFSWLLPYVDADKWLYACVLNANIGN